MANLSEALRAALESDCGHSLEPIVEARREEDFDALLEEIAKPTKADYRLKALHLLGRWGDSDAVAAIGRALPGFDELERCRAIDAVGRLGGAEALEVVLKHVEDPSAQVRKFVVHALARQDAPKARDAMQRIKRDDPADFVRALAP